MSVYDLESLDLLWTAEDAQHVAGHGDVLAVYDGYRELVTTRDARSGEVLRSVDAFPPGRPEVGDGVVYVVVGDEQAHSVAIEPTR